MDKRHGTLWGMALAVAVTFLGMAGASASPFDGPGFPVHGTFCGPGAPSLPDAPPPERVRILASIPAFDALDAACKAHDICYETLGTFDTRCDQNFVYRDLARLNLNPRCRSLGDIMAIHFSRWQPSISRHKGPVGALADVPAKAMEGMASFPFDAAHLASTVPFNGLPDRWEPCNHYGP